MSLIEDAKAAREAGLTYGQYMTHKDFIPYKKPVGPRCKNCNGPLRGGQQRFCSNECRAMMRLKTSRGDWLV